MRIGCSPIGAGLPRGAPEAAVEFPQGERFFVSEAQTGKIPDGFRLSYRGPYNDF